MPPSQSDVALQSGFVGATWFWPSSARRPQLGTSSVGIFAESGADTRSCSSCWRPLRGCVRGTSTHVGSKWLAKASRGRRCSPKRLGRVCVPPEVVWRVPGEFHYSATSKRVASFGGRSQNVGTRSELRLRPSSAHVPLGSTSLGPMSTACGQTPTELGRNWFGIG